jgi:hypothetical protein
LKAEEAKADLFLNHDKIKRNIGQQKKLGKPVFLIKK